MNTYLVILVVFITLTLLYSIFEHWQLKRATPLILDYLKKHGVTPGSDLWTFLKTNGIHVTGGAFYKHMAKLCSGQLVMLSRIPMQIFVGFLIEKHCYSLLEKE